MLSNCVKSSYFNVDMCPVDYSYIYIYICTYILHKSTTDAI